MSHSLRLDLRWWVWCNHKYGWPAFAARVCRPYTYTLPACAPVLLVLAGVLGSTEVVRLQFTPQVRQGFGATAQDAVVRMLTPRLPLISYGSTALPCVLLGRAIDPEACPVSAVV